MASRVICNPAEHPSVVLLSLIQGTPDAFTVGRRNNDMVNWFIAKRLIDLEAGERPDRSYRAIEKAYVSDMGILMSRQFTRTQQDDLGSWDERWVAKIERLAMAYGHLRTPEALYNLWLPMDYDDGVPANQTVLPGMDDHAGAA